MSVVSYNFKEINKDVFIALLLDNKPFIINNYLTKKELEKTTINNFCNKNKNIRVEVRTSGSNKDYGSVEGRRHRKFYKITLFEYYEKYILNNKTNDKKFPYIGNNVVRPEYFENLHLQKNDFIFNKLPIGKFWLGKKDSRTPLHKDAPHNLSIQLYGNKKWILINRKYNDKLYHRNSDQLEWSHYDVTKKNDYPIYEFKTNPGDLLFVPSMWSHDVTNINDSLMANFWFSNIDWIISNKPRENWNGLGSEKKESL